VTKNAKPYTKYIFVRLAMKKSQMLQVEPIAIQVYSKEQKPSIAAVAKPTSHLG